MHTKMITKKDTVLLGVIVAAAFIRVLNNTSPNFEALANYSPVAAMALFGGASFRGYARSFMIPVLLLLISDVVLYNTIYAAYGSSFLYEGWYWVYGAFVLMALAGKLIAKNRSVASITAAVFVSVFIHWIVTDLGVWTGSTTYPQTWAGFMACLTAAAPFELRLLAATVLYSAIMFGLSNVLIQRFYLKGSAE